jgi:hypothetical protein
MSLIQFRSVGDNAANVFSPIGNSLPTVMNFYSNRTLTDAPVRAPFVNGLIVPTNRFTPVTGDYTVVGNVFSGGAGGTISQRCTTSSTSAAGDFTFTIKRKPGLNVAGQFALGLTATNNPPNPPGTYLYGLVITANAADSPTVFDKHEGTVRSNISTGLTNVKQTGIDVLYRIQRVAGLTTAYYSVDDGNSWTSLTTYAPVSSPVVFASLYSDANQGIVVMESVGFA